MTRLWNKTESDDVTALQDELTLEALSTEKLRVIVLLSIISAVALVSLIPPGYFSRHIEHAFRGSVTSFLYWRFLLLSGLVIYLFAERMLLSYFIRSKRKIPTFYRYLTAFVETSCPTVAIAVTAIYTDPSSNLTSVPAYMYPMFIVLSALRLNFRLSVFTGAVAAIEYLAVGTFFLDQSNINEVIDLSKAVALLILGIVTGLVASQIKKRMLDSAEMADERNRIVSMFGKHVSPEVVNKLIAQGMEMQSEKKNVCVMFLDIRDYTRFAEKRSPEEVVSYLETLFEFMTEIVNRHNGIINKFLGDGFMAVFGAPLETEQNCLNAVNAAQEILATLRDKVAAEQLPPTAVGIGLHAGDAVTGSIGSALRKEYTVIGDVVNLASRIEKLNKDFGSELLISEVVRNDAFYGDVPNSKPMGQVQVRGRQAPIQVYQLA